MSTTNFTWGLGTVAKDTTSGSINLGKCIAGSYVYDGTYQVGAIHGRLLTAWSTPACSVR